MKYTAIAMLTCGLLTAGCRLLSTGAHAHAMKEAVDECRSRADVGVIVTSVTNWVAQYRASSEFKIERDGTNTYIRGTVGIFPSLFSKYDIIVELDSERQEAYCYGYLPTKVPDGRRNAVVEFLFRAECAYGLSPATLVLEEDGSVRCQSWLPFGELQGTPGKAIPQLVGSVMEKLYACSTAIGPVLLGLETPRCASCIHPVGLFNGEYESSPDTLAADTDKVLKKCFSDNEWTTERSPSGWIPKYLASADSTAAFIKAWISDVKRDVGGIYDRIDYTLVVSRGMVGNVCPLPIAIPKDRIVAVADAVMRLNQSSKCALFCVDFDNRKLWCGYSFPVSALCNCDEAASNRYRVFIKAVAPFEVARNSERLSRIAKGED